MYHIGYLCSHFGVNCLLSIVVVITSFSGPAYMGGGADVLMRWRSPSDWL